jgi:HEAT repeat protein
MAGLSSAEAPDLCEALAKESYRLLDPALRDGAMAVSHMRMFDRVDGRSPWDGETWPMWLRLLENVGIAAPVRVAWLSRMLADAAAHPEVGWRMATMRALAEMNQPDAYMAIVSMAQDADERVARFAARSALDRRNSDWRAAAAMLLRSPHASVRKLVSMRNVGGEDFGTLWHDYGKLPPAVQFSAAREAAGNKEDFSENLRSKLGSSSLQEVAQGLRMLSSLPKQNEYRAEIIKLCGHGDPRIAAIAIKLIGRLEDPRLRDLLEAATHHLDARVRANAIESMASLRIADRSQQVLAMLDSRHNRERANAIKALSQFDFSTARECLSRMLADTNPVHRMSALWVVGQLDLL